MFSYKIEVLPSNSPWQTEAIINERARTGLRLVGVVSAGARPYAIWEFAVVPVPDEETVTFTAKPEAPKPAAPRTSRSRKSKPAEG